MKLGSFAVSVPQYKIETQVTYQTIRVPTVFERMLMKLCKSYRTTPEIAQLALTQIFEQQLGVASASALVGPCVEELTTLGVLTCPASENAMSLRLADISLTPEGLDFLARKRLPSRQQQTKIQHLFLPLSNTVKPLSASNLPGTPASEFFIDKDVLAPQDCSAWVQHALEKERHPWKTANTEIHSVQSSVAGVVWEQHHITIECDKSGILSIKAPASASFEQWLQMAAADIVWQHILQPILTSEPEASLPELSEESIRHAVAIAPLGHAADSTPEPGATLLHVITNDTDKDNYIDEDLILLHGKKRAIQGTPTLIRNAKPEIRQLDSVKENLRLEMTVPEGLPSGLDTLRILKKNGAPQAHFSGWANVSWHGQAQRAALNLKADNATSTNIWQRLQTELQSGLNTTHDANAHALTSLWLPVQETITHWQSRNEARSVAEWLADASEFAAALERFTPHSQAQWQPYWLNALNALMKVAVTGLQTPLPLDDAIHYLNVLNQLVPDHSGDFSALLLEHCSVITDVASLEQLRVAVGPTWVLPTSLFSSTLLQIWLTEVLTDAPLALHEPHALALPIKTLRDAHQGMLRNAGVKSLTDAAAGNLSLKSVNSSALTSVTQWQHAIAGLTALRAIVPATAFSLIDAFDKQVQAWRELATRKLAHPEAPGKRFVIFDTSALIDYPNLPARLQQNDTPVIARRVHQELDHLKTSDNPDKARQARTAIRTLEQVNKILRYESEVLELLPADLKPTSDNRILSVALYLRLSDVILVTADTSLRNIARSENIMAILPGEYKTMSRSESRPHNTGGK
ncbi:PIN domain-containing protein [Pectobacterium jejuense]|uniref:PIN domain-containing protein n=1 Tax=Pectobacterium jejuense TaxID=2974022 RepID=UPI0037F62086